MITIKLPYKADDYDLIKEIIREQTIIKKWSFNRFQEGLKEKEVRLLSKNLSNISNIDSWFIQSSIYDGKALFNLNGNNKVIFNKNLFIRRQKGLISKEEYKDLKNNFLSSVGEAPQKGNRKFSLDISNNKVVFKPKNGIKIDLILPKIRNKYFNTLLKLEYLAKNKSLPISFKLDKNNIFIIFDESLVYEQVNYDKKINRGLGFDLNPNFIGVSVLDFDTKGNYKIVKTLCFDLIKLTGKNINHNKLKHETIEIAKQILQICKNYNVKFVFGEDLKIKSSDNGKGKGFNRLVNNQFLRKLIDQQLTKECKIYGISFFRVLPHYTSYIGNLQHDYYDPINSSIEICRRGYEVIILKNKQFYPKFWIKDRLIDQWKESINHISEWKNLFKYIKNSKLRYRVSLDECKGSYNVFRMKSIKSKVFLYDFI